MPLVWLSFVVPPFFFLSFLAKLSGCFTDDLSFQSPIEMIDSWEEVMRVCMPSPPENETYERVIYYSIRVVMSYVSCFVNGRNTHKN
jgi:hypothetical protein